MVKTVLVCHGSICRSPTAGHSAPATAEDLGTAEDLPETPAARRGGYVGMAANMIGAAKRIIVRNGVPI